MSNQDNPPGLGATGSFPRGKLREDDEGGIRVAVGGDPKKHLVIFDFGKSVRWLAMPPEDAEALAASLLKCAQKARGNG